MLACALRKAQAVHRTDQKALAVSPIYYNPDDHAREKQDSRERDARALASGEKSRAQLWAENSAVRGEGSEIDFSDCPPGSLR